MNQKLKVSVIVPVYNVEDIVSHTLNSLNNQTLQDVEYIIIDDGSTDNSLSIIRKFAEDNKHMKVITQANKGPAAARNRGLQEAQGDYICFVDSDDILPTDALRKLYNTAVKYDSDLVTGASKRFNSEKEWYIKSHLQHNIMKSGKKTIETNPELFYSIGPCAKLYKRTLLKGIFFPEELRFGEDQPLVLYAYLHAKNIYTINETVYLYRLREGNVASLTQEIYQKPIEILNDLLKMLKIAETYFSNYRGPSFVQSSYLERVVQNEIWSIINAALLSKSHRTQAHVFTTLNSWLTNLKTDLIDATPAISRSLILKLTEKAILIKPAARIKYVQLMNTALQRLDKKTLKQEKIIETNCYKAVNISLKTKSLASIYIYSLLKQVKKRLNRKKFQNFILRRIVFKFANAFPNGRYLSLGTNNSSILKGNLLAIYKELNNHPHLKVNIFLKKNRSFAESIKQYYILGRSKWIFLDDYYYQLYGLKINKKTEVIQTWHAAGAFKKFGFSALEYREANTFKFETNAHSIYTKILASSSNIVNEYAEAFNAPKNKILPFGLPRTDVFFDEDYKYSVKKRFYKKYSHLSDKKILLYAPTFRGDLKQRQAFTFKMDLDYLEKELGHEYVLILKLHPSVKEVSVQDKSFINSKFVFNMSEVEDINDLMIVSDLMITDYSSVIFEYAILQKPIIFYAYDLDDYLSERGFYFDYRTHVPGPIAENTKEIIEIIQNHNFDLEKLANFCHYYIEGNRGRSTKKVLSEIGVIND
ncbi:CDP-glycerol glycerophosphotransferase family protein [Bacillus paralicheniformis]|uniref:bifunctional glycosyltransferase/CDP-glycerol:glycerophosphate glycerophosphotransferase n=1 Tax=Bacillus paralicheniformis TaxID=1648923 RepID=UPI003D1A9B5B